MKDGSKSKDLGRKFGFSLLNFVVVFLFIIRAIGGFLLLLERLSFTFKANGKGQLRISQNRK